MPTDATAVLKCLANYREAHFLEPRCGGCCRSDLCRRIREVIKEEGDNQTVSTKGREQTEEEKG